MERLTADPLISIVIPVYNAEEYLRRCLNSVLAQTYRNIQVVCVDDGSSDGSAAILDDYVKAYGITVIHQQNSGVVKARNRGITAAKGDFVYFLDSDDYLPITALADLVALIDEETDLIFGDQVVVFKEEEWRRRLLPADWMTGFEYVNYSLGHGQGTIGGKMFRKSLCDCMAIDARFCLNEDLLMNVLVGLNARKVKYLNRVNYYYYWDSVCSLSKKVDKQSLLSIVGVQQVVKDKLLSASDTWWILSSGYLQYAMRNAERLISVDFYAAELSFVVRELRLLFCHHPLYFVRQIVGRRILGLMLLLELVNLKGAQYCYQGYLKLRGLCLE